MQFADKPSFASSYDFLVFSIEISVKNCIESWGQTFGTLDFDLQVWSVQASGSEVPGVEKMKFITPKDPSGVVPGGFFVRNYAGFCYRSIFIMDQMGRYVPNTSKRVLRIWVFFWEPLLRGCHSSPVWSGSSRSGSGRHSSGSGRSSSSRSGSSRSASSSDRFSIEFSMIFHS